MSYIGQIHDFTGVSDIEGYPLEGRYEVIEYDPHDPTVGYSGACYVLTDGTEDHGVYRVFYVDEYDLIHHVDPETYQKMIDIEQRVAEEEQAMMLAEEGLRGA